MLPVGDGCDSVYGYGDGDVCGVTLQLQLISLQIDQCMFTYTLDKQLSEQQNVKR